MPKVKVNDINIYYEIQGNGEVLVLISGYGANLKSWFRQIFFFSQEYRVIAFDNRGTGRSDKPDVPYTMKMMANDVAGLLEAIGIDTAHVWGTSMGGAIAQEFAIRYPEKVISLILGGTSCGGIHEIKSDPAVMAQLLNMANVKQVTPEEWVGQLLPIVFTKEFIHSNQDIIKDIIKNRAEYETPANGYRRQAEAAAGHDTYNRLPKIMAPTLVIAGSADRVVPVKNSKLLASMIPNAQLVILENVGHGFNVEAEEKTNSTVLDFLRQHQHSRQS